MPDPLAIPGVHGIDDIEFPKISSGTSIGICVAIAGNVLISLALNLQKLAHARLDAERRAGGAGADGEAGGGGGDGDDRDGVEVDEVVVREAGAWSEDTPAPETHETDPLIAFPVDVRAESVPLMHTYGAIVPDGIGSPEDEDVSKSARIWGTMLKGERGAEARASAANGKLHTQEETDEGQESDYLRSKLWWTGFLLMNVGEIGNFISYAFAPASVVAPLGTFALVANCFFAPLLLHERFRKRDLFGIAIAIIGAVTVVLSSNTSDTRLSPEGLIKAITQRIFVVYSIVYAVGMVFLAGLSEGRVGKRHVIVDLGLCALFGGFTVLATKGVSTLLTTRGFEIFSEWITYPIIAVLLVTGVGQIRYLNRALMRFDSKIVIPTQFVLFNLSAIVGSAILYSDFRRATFHQFVTFVYGCAATFAGVWIIAWNPSSPSDIPEGAEDDEEYEREDSLEVLVSGPPGESQHRRSISVGMPFLRPRRSTMSLVGLSPAQRVLLVHTPPRPEHALPQTLVGRDVEHGGRERLGSIGRRRAVSWLDEENPRLVALRNESQSREHGSVDSR